jgi:regulator of protease activity HflC (stomatin/prohibitin superfamily)
MFKNEEGELDNVKLSIAMVIGVFALIVLFTINPMVIVGAGQRGVVLKWGAVQNRILSPGINWVMPIRDM